MSIEREAREPGTSSARRPARVAVGLVSGAVVLVAALACWVLPARVPPAPDGVSYDRRDNALWLSRHWLHEPSSDDEIGELARRLAEHGITVVYPFLGPMDSHGYPGWRNNGAIQHYQPEVAASFRARFHAAAPAVKVLPWTGGIYGEDVVLGDEARISGFLTHVRWLVGDGGFDGIHLNVEPLPDDDPAFLELLRRVKAAMPRDRLLSVAAYPPTTPLHPYKRVHWSADYLDRVCGVADDLAVMTYDTALRWPRIYERLMAQWTREMAAVVSRQSSGCVVRLGVPTYEERVPWHDPSTETVTSALDGIRAGLSSKGGAPERVRGVAIYADWTTDPQDWAAFESIWVRGQRRPGGNARPRPGGLPEGPS